MVELHPLEPLTAAEVAAAVLLLQSMPEVTATTRIISIMRKEPDKAVVHQGGTADREAEAVLHDNGRNACFHAVVNLTQGTTGPRRYAPAGAQPTMSAEEQVESEAAVLASPEFRAALQRHYGAVDPALVMVDIWSAGNYGAEEDRTRRLARSLCFLRSDPPDNGYARPIEGIRPVVDRNEMRVLRIEEHGVWPLQMALGVRLRKRSPAVDR